MTERIIEFLLEKENLTLSNIEDLLHLTNNELMKQLYHILNNISHMFSKEKSDSTRQKIILQILKIFEIIHSTEDSALNKRLGMDGYIDEVYDTLDNMMDSPNIDTRTRILIYFFYQGFVRKDHHILFTSPIFGYTVMEEDFSEHMIFLRTKYLEHIGIRSERKLLKHLRDKLNEILTFNKYNFNFDDSELFYQRNGLIPLLCGTLKIKAKSLVPLLIRILREFIIQHEDKVSLEELTSEIRICSAWALKEIKGEEAIDALIRGMQYEYNYSGVHTSVVCAWALGELQVKKAIKPLFFARNHVIGYYINTESGELNRQLSEQATKSLQNMGITDDGLEYLYDGLRNSDFEFDDFGIWILDLREESITVVKRKLLESDSKEILEDSWWILIRYHENKKLSNDDLKNEISELIIKRKELLPILQNITSGARNGIRLKINNIIHRMETK